MRYRPSGRAVVIALWRANIKPPLEVVVDNLIEQIPETKIRMMNGDYYLVKDSVESIKDQVAGFFQRCVSIKKEMQI